MRQKAEQPSATSAPRTGRDSKGERPLTRTSPSAGLTNLLCNRCEILTPVVGADPFHQFLGRQEAGWFHNRPFAMAPSWFNGVEPRAFAGQLTDDQAAAACALDTLIVGSEPLPHDLTAVPGGIIPDQESRLLAVMGETVGAPGQIVTGDLAHGPPVDKAQQHGVGLRQEKPITREGFTVRVCFGRLFFHEAEGRVLRPGVHRGLGQATPPDFVLEA